MLQNYEEILPFRNIWGDPSESMKRAEMGRRCGEFYRRSYGALGANGDTVPDVAPESNTCSSSNICSVYWFTMAQWEHMFPIVCNDTDIYMADTRPDH